MLATVLASSLKPQCEQGGVMTCSKNVCGRREGGCFEEKPEGGCHGRIGGRVASLGLFCANETSLKLMTDRGDSS